MRSRVEEGGGNRGPRLTALSGRGTALEGRTVGCGKTKSEVAELADCV